MRVLVVEKKIMRHGALGEAQREHKTTLKRVLRFLKEAGVHVDLVTRAAPALIERCDLILAVGGDGTFLRAASYAHSTPIMGINSAPRFSIGALCSVKGDSFEGKLGLVLRGKGRIKPLHRLTATVNGKRIAREAVNDVLLSSSIPSATTRYIILHGKRKEAQKSSGVWISTASGSTAGIHAAGGHVMPRFKREMQFVVREPFKNAAHCYRVLQGRIAGNGKLSFVNQTVRASLYIDGVQATVPLRYGDRISLSLSQKPLRVVV